MKDINIMLDLIKKVNGILWDWQLISKYQSLINAINSNQIYNSIVSDIANFNTENNIDFPYVFQKKYAIQMWIYDFFWEKANEKLNLILDKWENWVNDIQNIINELSKIEQSFQAIYSNFTILKLIDNNNKENTYLELIFNWKFEINSISDFNKQTKDIEKHIKNLSKLTDSIVDTPDIVYISKNSPLDIVIDLWKVAVTTYFVLDIIIKRILDRIIQVQEIRKMQLEIENKEMMNTKIKEWLNEEIEQREKDFSDNLSNELFDKYTPNSNNWAKNEILKWTKDAIMFFDKLIVNWWTVNIWILPEWDSEKWENNKAVYNDILEKNDKKNFIMNEIKQLNPWNDTLESKEENIEE